jgi:prolyl oligopeptidase
VPDPFRPLENDTSAATKAWVEAENAVTHAYLAKIPFRGRLLDRLKAVVNYEKVGTPFEEHGKWYCFRNNGLQNPERALPDGPPGWESSACARPQ